MALLKLSREDLVEVDKLYKGGALDKPEPIRKPQSKATVRVRNSTNALFSVGAPIAISGFASSLSFAQARKRMVAGTLVLSGQAATSGAVVGACATPVASGKIGDVEIDIRFAIVTFSDSSHQFATETFASASSGAFRIVAKSGDSNGLAVCALAPVGGGGGTLSKTYRSFLTGISNVSATTQIESGYSRSHITSVTTSGNALIFQFETPAFRTSVSVGTQTTAQALTNVTLS